MSSREYILEQELRTERIINESKSSEIDKLNKWIESLKKENDGTQAKIDALMLEYCPDEMTEEQLKNYEKHQKKVAINI